MKDAEERAKAGKCGFQFSKDFGGSEVMVFTLNIQSQDRYSQITASLF